MSVIHTTYPFLPRLVNRCLCWYQGHRTTSLYRKWFTFLGVHLLGQHCDLWYKSLGDGKEFPFIACGHGLPPLPLAIQCKSENETTHNSLQHSTSQLSEHYSQMKQVFTQLSLVPPLAFITQLQVLNTIFLDCSGFHDHQRHHTLYATFIYIHQDHYKHHTESMQFIEYFTSNPPTKFNFHVSNPIAKFPPIHVDYSYISCLLSFPDIHCFPLDHYTC
ncbi:hypothetical protein V8B97DRAFT_1970517 [Scleroderma yunnanense]